LRNPNGVELTNDGKRLLEVTEKMETSFLAIRRNIEPNVDKLKGEIWISVTEGLGTVWLMPQAVELQAKNPDLRLRIDCQMDAADLSRNEADLCVQLELPDASDVKVTKVGSLHVMPFASRQYIEHYGRPTSLDDCVNHKFVVQDGPQTYASEFIPMVSAAKDSDAGGKSAAAKSAAEMQRAAEELLRNNTAIICNTSTAHYWAISKGGGIGLLPTYVGMLSNQVAPVDLGDSFRLRRDIWLSYHPDVKKIKRIRMAIDWIKDIFSGEKYPWFRGDFIHPDDLSVQLTEDEGFGDVEWPGATHSSS